MTIDRDRWLELQPLLDQALELSEEERLAWLGDLRSHSPAVAMEVAALFSSEAVADRRGFLLKPVEVSITGLEIGAYVLELAIGEGGMGTVWLARHRDTGHPAAIKFLHLALATSIGNERFRREGAALGRLAHPGIARLLDTGVGPGGQPYLVLEFVDGQPIDVFASSHALSRAERIRLVLQVLDAVGHAHAQSIVHRDLKPSNILVTADGRVKLLDFGIAKLLDAGGRAERTLLTLKGGRALTPEFAAPEQVQGATLTAAVDVYACGVLLYLLLSGGHPTAAGCRNTGETIRALFAVQPPPLGLGELDGILARALHKAPNERYATAVAFAEELERYLRLTGSPAD
jgi:eukaryotic-like serine/threonine-protein kinase